MIKTPPAARLAQLRAQGWNVVKVECALPSVRKLGFNVLWSLERQGGYEPQNLTLYT